jgi:glycosyltransferase involved in cell wall biosynthesis
MKKKLSIIIPTYNREATLLKAINSLTINSRNDIEIIISDDNSTDNTLKIIKNINDDRVILVQNTNHHNANYARNQGIQSSNSSLITFLDSDDEFLPDRVNGIVKYFDDNPECSVLVDSFVTKKGNNINKINFPSGVIENDLLESLLIANAIPITFSSISTRIKKTELENFLDGKLRRHQDRDFLLDQIQKKKCIHLRNNQDIVKHQVHDSFSRSYIGYISGLDAIVCKYAQFKNDEYKEILSYLIARPFIKSLFGLNLKSFLYNFKALKESSCLKKGALDHLLLYSKGRKKRKLVEKILTTKKCD